VIGTPSRRNSGVDEGDDALTMDLLAAHIPITLLLDLAETFGPPSRQILESEGHEAEVPVMREGDGSGDPSPLRTSPAGSPPDASIEA
jgi:hypothetical protein